ncbi:hypothetical protein TARUN_870 [Trichoderma arundinaceum]|uniref:Mid2 domain-containing protein n=1 Tax=Trichoderma arundinaceum TaxID=490622 RepID=A0A395NZD1_TRIAR|nr:hypothetical protein TARUN_870 [Trichoderma arundinaceum]
MSWKSLLLLTWFYILLPQVASSDLVVRNLPGRTSEQTVYEVRRRLANRVKRAGTNVLFDNSTSFALGLDDVTIFKYPFFESSSDVTASISIICTKCYIKGQASAKLTANGSFNISSAVDQVKDSFENTWDSITNYAKKVSDTIVHDIETLQIDEVREDIEKITSPEIDFNLDLKFPEYNVDVNLTDIEIYMQIDTVLSAGITYTFNIYKSETLVGIALGEDLLLGAVFSVDLIFSVNGQIDIQSGFHLHFDNVRTQIIMFGKEASKLDFEGGKFAFLPVTIQSGEVVLQAILRLEARIGISFKTFVSALPIPDKDLGVFDVGAGVEARVYANVAQFVTNITLGEVDSLKKRDDDCQLSIAQEYTFGIGAAAGASLVILGNTWGPTPETEIPIFYTTLAEACAVTSKTTASTATTAAASRSTAPGKRADGPSVTTTVTSETQTAVVCASSGLINCPASLQSVTKNVITKTLTSTVTSDEPVVWSTGPASTFKTVDFQADAVTMTNSAGAPKSYTPPPPPPTATSAPTGSATDAASSSQQSSGKHRVSNAVIIGVSVGLGVPVLLALIGAFIYFYRRHRRTSVFVPAAAAPEVTKAQPVIATYAPVRPEDD